MSTMRISAHARRRMQQRGITEGDIALAVSHGIQIHRTGVCFFFIGKKALRSLGKSGANLNGLTVLQALDGEVITAYKRRGSVKTIRCKSREFKVQRRRIRGRAAGIAKTQDGTGFQLAPDLTALAGPEGIEPPTRGLGGHVSPPKPAWGLNSGPRI